MDRQVTSTSKVTGASVLDLISVPELVEGAESKKLEEEINKQLGGLNYE